MRLRHLYTGELTWRELANLVRGLSPQSATRTALNGGQVEPSRETVLLADVFDAVSFLDFHFVSANSDPKKSPPKPPKPYPRWWAKAQQPDQSRERVAKLDDARRRKREREQAIAAGRIV